MHGLHSSAPLLCAHDRYRSSQRPLTPKLYLSQSQSRTLQASSTEALHQNAASRKLSGGTAGRREKNTRDLQKLSSSLGAAQLRWGVQDQSAIRRGPVFLKAEAESARVVEADAATAEGTRLATDGDKGQRAESTDSLVGSADHKKTSRKPGTKKKEKGGSYCGHLSGVVLTHVVADFDSLAAAVGLCKLRDQELGIPGATCVVLPKGGTPTVNSYLALHKNFFPIRRRQNVDPDNLEWLGVVDAQRKDRFGTCSEWLDKVENVQVYDHHVDQTSDIKGQLIIEDVGSAATVIVERLMQAGVPLQEHEATLLALGIHTDTGSLVYECTTERDARALAFCISCGASQKAIMQFVQPVLSKMQRTILQSALQQAEVCKFNGYVLAKAHVMVDEYMSGMAYIAKDMLDLTSSHVLIMAVSYIHKSGYRHVSIIGRARSELDEINLNQILSTINGGGHPKAAAASIRMDRIHLFDDPDVKRAETVDDILTVLMERICTAQIPPIKTVSDVMTPVSEALVCSITDTVDHAAGLMEANDIRALPVVDTHDNRLLGLVSIGDLVKVQRSGDGNIPIKSCMRTQLYLATPLTTLDDVEHILVDKGVGCVPVVELSCAMLSMVPEGAVVEMIDSTTPSSSPRHPPIPPGTLFDELGTRSNADSQTNRTHNKNGKPLKEKHKKLLKNRRPTVHHTMVGLITRSHVLEEHNYYSRELDGESTELE